MAAPELTNLSGLLDDAKCFAFVRQRRWPEGVRCPSCDTEAVIRSMPSAASTLPAGSRLPASV
jgi:Transposase zinc-ribbon domain